MKNIKILSALIWVFTLSISCGNDLKTDDFFEDDKMKRAGERQKDDDPLSIHEHTVVTTLVQEERSEQQEDSPLSISYFFNDHVADSVDIPQKTDIKQNPTMPPVKNVLPQRASIQHNPMTPRDFDFRNSIPYMFFCQKLREKGIVFRYKTVINICKSVYSGLSGLKLNRDCKRRLSSLFSHLNSNWHILAPYFEQYFLNNEADLEKYRTARLTIRNARFKYRESIPYKYFLQKLSVIGVTFDRRIIFEICSFIHSNFNDCSCFNLTQEQKCTASTFYSYLNDNWDVMVPFFEQYFAHNEIDPEKVKHYYKD